MKELQANNIQKILVRATNWVGDAVMTTPAIHTIRKSFPSAEITLLAKSWVASLFEASPDVDRIFIFDEKGRHAGAIGKWRLAKELQCEKFDAAILLQNAIEAALIAVFAKIPVRIGFNSDARGFLLTHSVKRQPETFQKHQTEYYLDILRGIGLPVENTGLRLSVSETDIDAGKKLLEAEGVRLDKPIVGLNPSATFGPAKQWPIERYADVAKRLIQNDHAKVIIFGGPSDIALGERLQNEIDEGVVLAGKTTLMQAAAVIGLCNVFITNDSGLMHVASALQTPTVAIFGSTNPVTTGPFSDRAAVVRTTLACSPCLKPECPLGHLDCMMDIQADKIYAIAKEMM